jgi:hypothetical protein
MEIIGTTSLSEVTNLPLFRSFLFLFVGYTAELCMYKRYKQQIKFLSAAVNYSVFKLCFYDSGRSPLAE